MTKEYVVAFVVAIGLLATGCAKKEEPRARLTGTVVDMLSGTPVNGVAARASFETDIVEEKQWAAISTKSGADGAFILASALGERDYQLEVEAQGYVGWSGSATTPKVGQTRSMEPIELCPLCTVAGTIVHCATSAPVSDAVVSFGEATAVMKEDGHFEIAGQDCTDVLSCAVESGGGSVFAQLDPPGCQVAFEVPEPLVACSLPGNGVSAGDMVAWPDAGAVRLSPDQGLGRVQYFGFNNRRFMGQPVGGASYDNGLLSWYRVPEDSVQRAPQIPSRTRIGLVTGGRALRLIFVPVYDVRYDAVAMDPERWNGNLAPPWPIVQLHLRGYYLGLGRLRVDQQRRLNASEEVYVVQAAEQVNVDGQRVSLYAAPHDGVFAVVPSRGEDAAFYPGTTPAVVRIGAAAPLLHPDNNVAAPIAAGVEMAPVTGSLSGGTEVVLRTTRCGSLREARSVLFGDVRQAILAVDENEIRLSTSASAQSGDVPVSVLLNNGTSCTTGLSFTYGQSSGGPLAAPQPTVQSTVAVRASSEMEGYEAAKAVDGDSSTAWGMRGDPAGQWLELDITPPAVVSQISMQTGFVKTASNGLDVFSANRRLHDVHLIATYADGTTREADHSFADDRSWQTVPVPGPTDTAVRTLRIVIKSTFEGLRWQDTHVSEIRVELRPAGTAASGGAAPTQVSGLLFRMSSVALEAVSPPPADATKTRRPRRDSGRAATVGGLADWDTAFNQVVDDDADRPVSAASLTTREVAAKVQAQQIALLSCAGSAGLAGSANIEMLIRGREVVAARSPGQTAVFESCVQRTLAQLRFDGWAAGQMRASFTLTPAGQ